LRRSAGLVGNNLGRAIGLVVGAMVAAFVTWLASVVLHFIPVVGISLDPHRRRVLHVRDDRLRTGVPDAAATVIHG
jgi:hypothetical protein